MTGQTSEPLDMSTQAPSGRLAGRVLAAKWDNHDTFTVAEAGDILGLSRGSAYAAAKSGTLPVVWIGRRCIVPRRVLEKLLDM